MAFSGLLRIDRKVMRLLCVLSVSAFAILLMAAWSAEPDPATSVTSTSATLVGHGTVDSADNPFSFWWQIADTSSGIGSANSSGSTARCVNGPMSVPAGTYTGLQCAASGLDYGKTYYYKMCGNPASSGPVCGSSTEQFSTPLPRIIDHDLTLTAAGGPYVSGDSTGWVIIDDGVTVTVEAGVEIQAYGFVAPTGAILDVQGTAADPVVFNVGWGLELDSDDAVVDNAVVSNSLYGVFVDHDSPTITNSSIHDNDRSGIHVQSGDAPTITDNTVADNEGNGIEMLAGGSSEIARNQISGNTGRGISYESASTDSGTIAIHDNTVEDNTGHGIYINGSAGVSGQTFEGNAVNDNGGFAISYASAGGLAPDITENPEPNGNLSDAIWLGGKVTSSATWTDHGYPLVNGGLSVTSGATLTLDPGLVVKNQGVIDVWGDGSNLIAEGTAADPITFTSLKDDSIYGDTNADGSATSPQPGQWGTLYLGGSPTSTLDNVIVRYAQDGITTIAGSNSITNSTIRRNSQAGVSVTQGGNTTVSDNTISDNGAKGVSVSGGGSPDVGANSIEDNQGDGVGYNASASQSGAPQINDNDVEDNQGDGISVTFALNNATGSSLSGNTVTNNAGKAIYWYGGKVPADIVDNPTVTGNGQNGLWISAYIPPGTSMTWQDPGYPIVPYANGIGIHPGATLTLGPGVVIKGGDGATFWNQGTLNVEGTKANPVTFTSIKDDSLGGDTNADGSATTPQAADWDMLWFGTNDPAVNPGTGTFDYVKMSYGGGLPAYAGMINIYCPCPSPPTFRHALITHSNGLTVYGNSVGGSAPIISWSRFVNNSAAITKQGTEEIDAPDNDYGSPSGPKDKGAGDRVVGPVNTDPLAHEKDKDCGGKDSQDEQNGKKCNKHDGDPVALATGEFSSSVTDLRLRGKSSPLEFTRTYNSLDSNDSGLGPGWALSGLIGAYEQENGDVLIIRSDGRQDLFAKDGSDYVAPTGVHDRLAKQGDGTFELTTLEQIVFDFDESGRIASITDAHDQETTYGYNSSGRLQTITDPSNQQLSFSYNANNHITEVTDSTGRAVSYTYDSDGNLETVTDPLDGITTYDYDGQHRLTSITDPRDNTILENTYDAQGRVIEQHDGLDNVWTLDYSPGQTEVTDPENETTTYQFDSQLRLTSETDPLNHTTSYEYNSAGDVTKIVRPGGAESDFSYDSAGNLTQATGPEGGERDYSYDSANHLTGYTDPREKSWSYDWSGNDLTTITDPADNQTEIAYGTDGLPTAVTDPNNHTTSYDYDSKGNLESVTDPLDVTTTYSYDARNYLTSVQQPGKAAELYDRSALGDVLSVTTPEGHETDFDYDPNGFLVGRTDPASNEWVTQRDAMEHPTAYVDPADNQISVAYDGNLNPTQITDRRDEVTTLSYDADQRLTGIDRPEGESWQYGYDARGNLTEVMDPRSNVTDYSYDLNDRLTEADQPLSITTSYGYDDAGNLTSVIDPRANETDYSYDDLGRLAQIDQPLGKTTTYAYDEVGNRTSRTTALGSVDYAYDDANRLTEISSASNALRTFAYDDAGRLTGATDADDKTIDIGYDDDDDVTSLNDDRGQSVTRAFNSRDLLSSQTDGRGTISYAYDELGRLASMTDPQSDQIDFGYDPEGNLTSTELPNGVDATNTYDGNGRMLETSSQNGSTPIDDRTYTYDDAGNRSSFTDRLNQTASYAYDALDRLTEFDPPGSSNAAYAYDAAGNRTQAGSTTFSYNEVNQLTSDSNSTTYTYDDAGRMTETDNGTQDTTYSWDPLDQLTQVDDGTTATAYTYDGLGRRSERTEGSTTETAHYGDLSDMPILDTDASGIIASYVQGPTAPATSTSASNEPVLGSDAVAPLTPSYFPGSIGLVEQRSGSATAYPLADAHGDVTTLTDDSGAVSSRQEFDPWGMQTSGPAEQMGYLGAFERRMDPDVGLLQMGVRSYDPGLGQFLSEDPMLGNRGISQTLDRYAYAGDEPVAGYDLDGRAFCMWGKCPEDLPGVANDVKNGVGDVVGAGAHAAGDLTGVNAVGCALRQLSCGEPGITEPVGDAENFAADRAQDAFNYGKAHISQIAGGVGSCLGGLVSYTQLVKPWKLVSKKVRAAICLGSGALGGLGFRIPPP